MKYNSLLTIAVCLSLAACDMNIPIEYTQTLNTIKLETFTDNRDGQVYRKVKIGNQVWMADNLRYLPKVNRLSDQSTTEARYYVYDYDGTTVSEARTYKTGYTLYNYNGIPEGLNVYKTAGVLYNKVATQVAPPKGWRLPTKADFEELQAYLKKLADQEEGSNEHVSYNSDIYWYQAMMMGECSEAGKTLGWEEASMRYLCTAPYYNYSGFNAVPSGYISGSNCYGIGNYAYYWTSDDVSFRFPARESYNIFVTDNTNYCMSIRCIEDPKSQGGTAEQGVTLNVSKTAVTSSTVDYHLEFNVGENTTLTGLYVLVGTSASVTIDNASKGVSYSGVGNLTAGSYNNDDVVDELTANTQYYLRACATTASNTYYSNSVSFKTSAASTTEGGATLSISTTSVSSTSVGYHMDLTVKDNTTLTGLYILVGTSSTVTINNASKGLSYSDVGNLTAGDYNDDDVVNELTANTQYYLRACATTASNTYYSNTVPFKTTSGSTNPSAQSISIADFKKLPDSDTYYTLSGQIWMVYNSTYGNIYLADETGLLPVYGLTATQQTTNDQSYSSLGLYEADYITICAKKSTFTGGLIEAQGAYFISKDERSSTSTYSYALEPTTKHELAINELGYINVYPYQGSDYAEVSFFLNEKDDYRKHLWIKIYCDKIDETHVLEEGTFYVSIDPSYHWACGGSKGNNLGGYDDPTSLVTQTQPYFGYHAPFYFTSGSVKSTKSGSNTILEVDLTSYNGSTLKQTFTVDLKSNVSGSESSPARTPQQMLHWMKRLHLQADQRDMQHSDEPYDQQRFSGRKQQGDARSLKDTELQLIPWVPGRLKQLECPTQTDF